MVEGGLQKITIFTAACERVQEVKTEAVCESCSRNEEMEGWRGKRRLKKCSRQLPYRLYNSDSSPQIRTRFKEQLSLLVVRRVGLCKISNDRDFLINSTKPIYFPVDVGL